MLFKPVFIQGLRGGLRRSDTLYLRVEAVYSHRSMQSNFSHDH